MAYNVRCSKESCKCRYVFAKHPDDYKVRRKCKKCGGTKFRVDRDRMRGEQRPLCGCGAYEWDKEGRMQVKHRIGGGACWFNKDGSERPYDHGVPPAADTDGSELGEACGCGGACAIQTSQETLGCHREAQPAQRPEPDPQTPRGSGPVKTGYLAAIYYWLDYCACLQSTTYQRTYRGRS